MPDVPTMWTARHVRAFVILLGIVTLASAVWPVYRSFLDIDISINEPWNAYFSDAAVTGGKVYPSREQFITNNYPPLSFYIVGAAGRILGDTILAGRLLSLLAILAITANVARIIRFWGGGPLPTIVGALYCSSGFLRLFPGYAGINDPQLLAHAVMSFGFLGFLQAIRRDRGYIPSLVVMIAAGFIKHNIVAMPVVAFAWLALERPRRLFPLTAVSAGIVVLGFALCHLAFGADFWRNMRTPRSYDFKLVVDSVATLQWPLIGLLVWLYVGIVLRKLPAVRFCNVWTLASLSVFLLQKASEGVAENAMFDLFMALSVAMGIAFAHAEDVPLAKKYPATRLQVAVLMAIGIRLLTAPGNEAIRLVFDPGFHDEIRLRESAMRESVAKVKDTPGDVLSAAIVCYRAGKPFVVDTFNFQQRVKAGEFPATILDERIAAGLLTRVLADPRHAWCNAAD